MKVESTCEITHRQILAGFCPWCKVAFSDGQVDCNEKNSANSYVKWNVDVMLRDLDNPDQDTRLQTITNLFTHRSGHDSDIRVFAKALRDLDKDVRFFAREGLSRIGCRLSDESATRLEKEVGASNYEVALRLVLLGYYFKVRSRCDSSKRRAHILWVIENAAEVDELGPECEFLAYESAVDYQQAKQVWLAKIQVKPNMTTILNNAANFFLLNEPEFSGRLLQRCQSLEPENLIWCHKLGHLHAMRKKKHKKDFPETSSATYSHRTHLKHIENSTDRSQSQLLRLHCLSNLSTSAFDANENNLAANYAVELLSLATSNNLDVYSRNDGNAVHVANTILGRVALKKGDIEQAKLHLLDSGRIKSSPNLSSFGPNMSLANELLVLGERDTVIEFLNLCSNFWHDSNLLVTWIKDIRDGLDPEFGPNLDYW